MRIIQVLFFFLIISVSCSKKQKEIKDMNIPEPDFSEMIRKSDSTIRQSQIEKATKQIAKENLKEVPEEIINKTPAEAFKNTPKEAVKITQKEVVKIAPKVERKQVSKLKVRKTSKVEVKKVPVDTSGLIYTVQIAAVDRKSKKFSTINNVITYNENSLVKYSLGAFKTLKEANKYRLQINKKYKGAFVKALRNNVPVSIK